MKMKFFAFILFFTSPPLLADANYFKNKSEIYSAKVLGQENLTVRELISYGCEEYETVEESRTSIYIACRNPSLNTLIKEGFCNRIEKNPFRKNEGIEKCLMLSDLDVEYRFRPYKIVFRGQSYAKFRSNKQEILVTDSESKKQSSGLPVLPKSAEDIALLKKNIYATYDFLKENKEKIDPRVLAALNHNVRTDKGKRAMQDEVKENLGEEFLFVLEEIKNRFEVLNR